MKRLRFCILIICVGLCSGPRLFAQSEVVAKAMKDEINRNIEGLKLKGLADPFFISYKLTDSHTDSFDASWGTMVQMKRDSTRTTSVRLLVGDYEFNDESLEGTDQQYPDYASGLELMSLPMGTPLGDNYYGIRQIFWKSTESVYHSAANKYKSYVEKLAKENKKIEEVLHKKFAKVPVVKYRDEEVELQYSEADASGLVNTLSGKLMKVEGLDAYRISLVAAKRVDYFITTEGTEIVENNIDFELRIVLTVGESDEGGVFQMYTYTTAEFDEMNNEALIWEQIQDKISGMMANKKARELDQAYDGPILFLGKSFGNAFNKLQLAGQFSASQDVDTTSAGSGYNYSGMDNSLEKRMGKRVSSRNLSILALPSLKEFNGERITSGYQFDSEGVKSPDSLLLVEKGVLKNLANERNVLKDGVIPNGTASGLGTLLVETNFNHSEEDLKRKLVELAEDEGLDFAVIARGVDDLFADIEFYKVDIETGAEQLLKNTVLANFSFNKLRKLEGANTDLIVNGSSNFSGAFMGGGIGGTTLIHPSAVLMSDLELGQEQSYNYSMQNEAKKINIFPVPDPRKAARSKK